MDLVQPVTINDTTMLLSNVLENDQPVYNSGTTYNANDLVMYNHVIYKSLVGSNLNNQPDISPDKWSSQGATNRWKMFDGLIGSQTVNNTSIQVKIATGRANAIALFDLDATSINIKINNGDGGTEIYNQTFDLFQPADPDWWSFFYAPLSYKQKFALNNLPLLTNAVVTVTLYNVSTGVVKCGLLTTGLSTYIGAMEHGQLTLGIKDYSIKSVDSFGNYFITKRRFADLIKARVYLNATRTDQVKRVLSNYRSTPVAWIGDAMDTYESTTIYGFYQDFEIALDYPTESLCTITIEGLI